MSGNEAAGDTTTATPTGDAYYGALLDDDPEELYQQAPCAYLSTLPDGTIAKVNATFLSWTGHERSDLVGRKRLQDLFAPGGRIHFETHLAPMLRMQGRVREIATEIVCPDGKRLPVVMNAVGKHTASGVPIAYRVALFDATERRSYERELMAARHRAEASEAKARALAGILQASFLPPELIQVPGLDVAGGYRPSGAGDEVGGDFYDVFETGRGTWAIVVGDVSGKGPAAAPVTALARYAVRAEAHRTPYPSAILHAVHEAVGRSYVERYCTAALLCVTPKADEVEVVLSTGGHPLPVLVRDGEVSRIGTPGTALGVLDDAELFDVRLAMRPGDVLVVHTDGVSEARRGREMLDDEGLDALLLGGPIGDAGALVNHIVDGAVAYQDGDPKDDIAVVVLRVP